MKIDSAIDLNRVAATDDALALVPARLARRWQVLPLMMRGERLVAISADPDDLTMQMKLENHLGCEVELRSATAPELVPQVIDRYYSAAFESASESHALAALERSLNRALLLRCSDVHLDPEADRGVVRMRVDGMMRETSEFTMAFMTDLISAVKVAARLDISEKRIPQDGQMNMECFGETISLRVALVPTLHGEKATLRILASAAVAAELSRIEMLGMNEPHRTLMSNTLDQAHGMILLSGPTGSGKTTTLYAALRHLREPRTRHIISIENPVEIPLNGITQISVDEERTSFSKALRSVLRHDPDVIMIGEIRDAESADIAMKSALTGHLVLATIHANTSIAVMTRLINLGVAPEMVASALRLVIAQRLVRRPCRYCVAQVEAGDSLRDEFGWADRSAFSVLQAQGCPLCAQSGYAGRLGLYEMVPMTGALREMIHDGVSEVQMANAVFGSGKQATLRVDGADKVRLGLTTPEEVRRVTIQEAAHGLI
jgi:type II secretory ATPase GspE/PulE/Tfp pilus assembly ATPase PilB-like protein